MVACYKLITQRIQLLIKELSWSQKKLAEVSKISTTTISRWKQTGAAPPEEKSIDAIVRATGCSKTWLTNGTGEMFDTKLATSEPSTAYAQAQPESKEQVFKQQAVARMAILLDWIKDEYGTNAIAIEKAFHKLEEGCPDFRAWKNEKMFGDETKEKKKTGTDN